MTDHTGRNRQLFDQVAASYDGVGFLKQAAQAFASRLTASHDRFSTDMVRPDRFGPSRRVLDIATGTGEVAAALGRHGATVVGIDLAPEMVAVARQKNVLPNVTFEVMDASALPFEDSYFDAVVCAAGLFFMPDLHVALLEWRRVLKPGGLLAFSSFGRGLLGPLPALWQADLAASGLKAPAPPLGRIPTVEAATELLQAAGLRDIEVSLTTLTYQLPTPQSRWADILAGLEGTVLEGTVLEGTVLRQLDLETRAEVTRRHQQTLMALDWPLSVPVPLVVATAKRSEMGSAP